MALPLAEALPGMPKRLFACTPSRLASFDCPRRYRFTYLDRPAPPRGKPWAHNSVGAVVHLALAKWWSLPVTERTPQAGERLVAQHWQHEGFRDADHSRWWCRIAASWVSRYLCDVNVADEPIGVERTVSATTRLLAVSGRVDRIDLRADGEGADGELVVVDYKTGRSPCTEDDARSSLALALYVLAVRRTLRRACRRVELHHVPSGSVAAFEHSDESLARHVARAEATADDIVVAIDTLEAGAGADEMFPPNPTPGCSWCDFRAVCPEGRAASSERDPWDGLDGSLER